MSWVPQIAFNGLVNGLAIAVLASAFSVVYLPTRVFCLALAGVYSAAAFTVWSFLQAGWPGWASAILGIVASVGLALTFELANHRPLRRRRAPDGAHLVSSLGLYIVTVQAISMIWDKRPRTLRAGLDPVYHLGPLVITRAQALIALGSIVLLCAFFLVLTKTKLGLRLRAMAANPGQLALLGVNTEALAVVAFGLAGVLTGACSILNAFESGFDAFGGLSSLVLAIVAVIVGGRHRFLGAVLGALVLGLARALATWFLSAQWQEVVTFLLLGTFLVLRPEGILKANTRVEDL